MHKVLGFVAFRKGSKRLPLKNGKLLGGKTLYQITLEKLVNLKQRGIISGVVASTDCVEWQSHCKQLFGNDVVIHQRSEAISGDFVNEGEVILDFFNQHPQFCDAAIMLSLCTYPYLKIEVMEAVALTYKQHKTNVYAIKETHHMPQKLLRINDEGCIRPYFQDSMKQFESNTKLLKAKHPISFNSTGLFLIHNAFEVLKDDMNLWNNDAIHGVVDDSFHLDIDTEEDFKLAELYSHFLESKLQ